MKVALLLDSEADFARLEPGVRILRELQIPFEARVLSAHHTPKALVRFVEDAPGRRIRLFLCAAGGAAHLAGVVAAHTDLPVIGIPMDDPPLDGRDALLATVQMPGGVPVAAVGAGSGGPANAALFAARVISLADPALALRYSAWREEATAKVAKKDAALQSRFA